MEQKQVTIVAADLGESNMAKLVADALSTPEIKVVTFFGDGQKPFPHDIDDMRGAIAASDLVLVTLSEWTEPEVEAACYALEYNVALGVIALGSGFTSWQNPAFSEILRRRTVILFVVTEAETEEARRLFPNTTVVACGNPEWETFPMRTISIAEVQNRVELATDEVFVLVIGDKKVSINLPLFVSVLEAVCSRPDPERYKVICSVHPGHDPLPGYMETPTDQHLVDFYGHVLELGKRDRGCNVSVSCKGNPYGIGAPQMVGGADIVIGGTSTELIRSAYLRQPTVAVLMHEAFPGVRMPLGESGWWMPCDSGAIAPVYGFSSHEISRNIGRMMTRFGYQGQFEAQEKVFPVIEPGKSLNRICTEIKNGLGLL